MAFYMGVANTASTLLTALINNCTANSWVNNNGILNKTGCYIKPYVTDNTLAIAGGTGQSGSALTGTVLPENNCPVSFAGVDIKITYPLTYYLHIFDTEVYMLINYNVDFWSYIAFGQSPAASPGTGNWYSGTGNGSAIFPSKNTANRGSDGCIQLMMFPHFSDPWTGSFYIQAFNSFIQHGFDGNSWSCGGAGVGSSSGGISASGASMAMGTLPIKPLLNRIPNAWNGEAILLPITPIVYRPEDRRSIVGNIKYAYYTRNDNYEPGQIITIGNLKYKVYPWLKKNSQDRNAANDKTHSGTFALAVLYDGD